MDHEPSPADGRSIRPAHPSPGAARILIVDDDPKVSQAVAEMAAYLGHAPFVCPRADQVLRHLESHPVDLLLIDYRMPEMTGLDLILLLRRENRNIPIVMMTGYAQTESRVSALRLEDFIILKKPIAIPQLAKAIEDSLQAAGR